MTAKKVIRPKVPIKKAPMKKVVATKKVATKTKTPSGLGTRVRKSTEMKAGKISATTLKKVGSLAEVRHLSLRNCPHKVRPQKGECRSIPKRRECSLPY